MALAEGLEAKELLKERTAALANCDSAVTLLKQNEADFKTQRAAYQSNQQVYQIQNEGLVRDNIECRKNLSAEKAATEAQKKKKKIWRNVASFEGAALVLVVILLIL